MDRKNVEDLYLLSPLQQGMLFHTLYAPGSGAYVEQTVLVLGGRPRAAELRRAWQMVVERHPVLRTGFVWEGVPRPLQVVFRKVDLPWREEDWSGLGAEERDARWRRLLEEDRAQGFDLLRAPLMRFALVRTGAEEHRLLWTSHHILTDGWSLPIVLNDFASLYHGLLAGAPPRLRPVRPFRDYIAWLNRQDAAAAERYWTARLAGLGEPTPLPLDRAPSLAGDPPRDHAQAHLRLPADAAAALDEAARRLRVTASAILQGAWAVVLARMSAVDDVVFGTTVSGRPPEIPGVGEIVGMFINTIPVRATVDDAMPLDEWLRGIHREHAAAGEFEHAPLAEMQKWAGVHEKAGLFETLLVYENYPLVTAGAEDDGGPPPEGALELVGMESTERTDLPLSVAVGPAPDGMRVSATYDPRRLADADARRLLEGLAEVVRQVTSGAVLRVADLAPFTEDERRRPLACWSGALTDPVTDTVPALFRAAAAAAPDAVAVRADGRTMTYGELDAASNRLARHLRALGAGTDARVGISLPRSADLVVALLAILKAGAAYVPLDPAYPHERLAYMRRDADLALVLVDGDAPAWAEGARVVSLAAERDAVDALPADDLDVAYDPDALAYVVYTSGSTGQPKGVAVPHRAVVRLVRGADWVCLGADETLLLLAPVAFDASTFEIWGALLNGGALVVHPPEAPDPARLGAFLREQGVTTLWMTAGLFHQVVDADPSALGGVRQVLTGGDVVSPAHVRRLMDACPGLRVIDGYGPTENTTFTTTHTVRPEDLHRPSLPIGRPISGTQAYVVDGRMRPLPAGVPGELVAGGEGLARGYLGRPGLTAERFVPDSFGAPGSRLYRTGDRVRWADDGTLEFLGRMDQQVKVRGYRIEPGEVEAALKQHPAVGDAVVVARADGAGGKRLVAYVVPRDGARPAPAELREDLAGRMPGHMVPSAFVVLDALPLTPNGKVDRRALPAPQVEGTEGSAAPQTPTEEVLAGLWSELLGVESPGREDDFFHLGGHSLIATQLVSRARQAFGVELPLRVVFESPTLAAMAEQVDGALRAAAGGTAVPPLVPAVTEGVDLPLSFAQEGLWFVDRLDPGSSVYNVPFTTRLRGPLDTAALERALDEIIRRHGALRTRFVVVDSWPVQRVLPPEPFHLPVEELSGAADPDGEARRIAAEWALLPYDLARDPLIRARLLRVGEDEHVLLTAMHHIVCDGWSMGVFWRELATLYEAFSQGQPSPLPPLTLQYGDFALWQRGWLTHEAVDAQAAWWREQMAGAPALLEIPGDRPRPASRSGRGALVHVGLPAELTGAARTLARAEGATLYMALVAAWSAVLSRWSGQDDVVVGTPIAGRTNHELEALIGLFVNTLPVRADLSGDPTFRALLRRVREATLGAYAHQDLPFERLVEDLQPGRSLSHTPLFQAMLAFNNTPAGEGAGLAGLRMEGMEETGGVARTDLTLSFAPGPDGGVAGTLEYATDLWDRGTMERLVAHFVAALRAGIAAPETTLAALPLMADAERAEVVRLGAAVASHPAGTTLHAAFAAAARTAPFAPAVTCGERTLSYGELDAAADRLARRLVARGAGPERLVGLCVERSLGTVVGILGILKAGAAYLPLDPAYPDDRLAYMLEDSGAQLVVTTADLADRIPSGVDHVWLDEDETQSAPADSALPEVSPDALAYVIYTSGSTGRPKGVGVTHGNVARLFAATDASFGFGAGDVWTLFHSYAFDFSVWELWGALLYGGRLVVVPFEVSRDPARFLGLLRDERVTVLNQTPSAFRQLIRADEDTAGTAELALRCVVFGGEALDPASLRPWVERRGDARPQLVNMYGITETTVHVTHRVIREADVRAGSASPIGLPIPDLSVHLLDRRGQPVPLGVVGEMYVGGGGVARGYLHRPGLTAERFVPDPFGAPGSRLYRSGDLARRRADGSLEFMGRADDQVKVRGFRIELGEIESVLLEHPAVREAVVLARGGADDQRLVAWVVGDADAATLRTHLLAHLPDYMVPSAFVPLDALPLTRNGKVDRRALPDPDAADLAGAAYVAPRTPAEEVLAALWGELLGVDRVGVEDGFFDLGGHSLLAMRLVSAARGSFGVEVPVRAVFEHPTLGGLAAELERLLGAGARQAPPLRPVPRDGDLPLSFAQERLWFVDRLEPGSPVYHMSFPYLLRGSLDTDALRRAWTEIVRRHETLRTALPFTGEQPVQRIAPPGPVDLPMHDLSHLAEAERDAAARARMDDVANRPFDLERGPLHRAELVRLGDGEHLLLITLHHVISDGWSLGVAWNELSALYTAFSRGEPSPLPPLPIQYGDFAVWQRAWLTGEVLDAQLGYWRRKLAGAPPLLELPTDRPRPAVQTYAGAEAALVLEGADAEAVLQLGRREGSTLFMVLLAAMSVVFARLSGQDDVVIGTPIAGRTRRETEGLIGLFLNSLALRTDLSGAPTFRELLRRVRETTLEAYAHQDLPFERILQELAPERSLSHSPLFQVMLNLANFAYGDASMPGLEVHGVEMDAGLASKFDLTVYAGEGPESLSLYLVYNTALFDADRARSMLEQVVAVLRQAAADVERPIRGMSLLTESARSVLPDPAAPLSDEWRGSVPEIFAAHAARTPDALAVEDPAERWTYAELEAGANAIAHRLVADGVCPGDVVAIHGHRSAALVRALVGTLRAGAAFLVLDPAYPPARLAEYVRIARPRGWLPIAAAGDVPAELADALAESVVSTILLGTRADAAMAEEAASFTDARRVFRAGGQRAVAAAASIAVAEPDFDVESIDLPLVEIGPDSLAYLSFTSGTTGRPKAVMGRHGSLTHFTPWLAERFGIGADDRFSLLSGLAHDPLHRDVFTPLQLGASIVAPEPDEVGTPGYLAGWMRDARITIAHLTPAMGQLLVDVPAGESVDAIDSLRRAFFVGDVLTRTDVERLHRLAPSLQVVNYYGSTETQRAVAHFVVPRDASALAKDIVPVGTGIPDVQVVIRNAAGERAGVGEVGEMWMRSPHVALGYLGDPQLTAERFVHGAYRTGDLGRYRPDGVAEIAGRADQQVKIRGFRIEPGEIEAVLRAHPSVRDTAVVARGEGDAKRLVAYVVAEGDAPAADAFRAHLKGHVPDYMVPAAWVFLDALPLTPNGKVDRRALPEPETSAPDAHVAPRTPTEAALAEIWAELLGAPAGAHDDFFALGGHSLLATRLVGRVRAALGVELPLRALFEAPTLAAMAARVDELLRAEAAAGPPPIVRRAHGGQAPASFAQERMWFVDRLEGGGPVYHIPTAQHLSGPVDVDAMRRALQELVRRHETLRTSLPEVDGVPVQRIVPPGPADLPFVDLSHLSAGERSRETERLAEGSANDPFDLEAGPLFRVSLVRLAENDHLLLANLHHAIGDGWSMRVLLGELAALHDAYRRGEGSPLAPLPVQYADYAAWQREWLRGPVLDTQLAYWRGRLAGAPPLLHLPTDRPRPEAQGHRGASEAAWLSPEESGRVAELGRREGATVFMVLLAAFGIVLSRWSGQDDVVVGTPIAGRTRPELEGLIGLFLNSLALRTDLSGEPTFAELLRRVRETTLAAYAHQDLPFERVLEDLRPERSLSHTPVFQVMLNLLNYGGGDTVPAADDAGGMTSLGAGAQLASKFDLTLYAAETPEGIGLHAVYDADLFDALRMRALLAQVMGVLRQAAEDADRPVSALSLLAEEDAVRLAADASPVVVRTRAGAPAGIGELGEVWMRGPDGTLRPMGGAGRYRPDGTVELATAPVVAAAKGETQPAHPLPAASEAAEAPGRPPRTETERMVAAVWGEVLGIPAEGIAADADFFVLGGHSLRATQVLSRIRARAGVRVPVRTFFAAPTVAALAAAVDAEAPPRPSASTGTTESAIPAPGVPVQEPLPHSRTDALTHSYPAGVYPLSFAQQRLWVLMQLGTSVAYNMASALRFQGLLDDWALERSLDEIVRRHETLRTRIEVRDGEPVQVVQPPRPLRLRAEEVRADGDTSVDDALRALAEQEAATPFPAEGPFLRVRLLRAADDDHVLLWTTHHLVSDGWSLGVFQAELTELYRSFVSGEGSPLRPLPVQYGQHALEQRRNLSGPALDALAGWWKERLAGAPALLELPTDRPRPAEPSGQGASFWFSFPDGTAERVAAFARGRRATPFMVLLAAFQALLSRWSGQDDVVVGTPIANRTRPELEGLIGFFANTLAIRGDLAGDPTFASLLERVREATLGAYEHQDMPFERLVEELNPERSLSHAPVFQVMFVLQNAPDGNETQIEGLTLSGLPREREAAKYDLTLTVLEHGGQAHGRVEYAADLFDAPTMDRLVGGLVVLLDAALRRPETPVSDLPLLDDDDRRALLDGSAGPVTPVPDVPLHALFEAQSARTPQATALVFGPERITYGQLDARANRLAHLLRARGIGPDQPVAVLMERSVEMVVALYGILKAGAAYVPVDPEYPADRVAYMLEDSAAALVLTQERWLDGLMGSAEAVALDAPGVLDAFPATRLEDGDAAGMERLAYVIYTSGSTGRPKGAMNAHRGVVNRIAWMQDAFGLTPDDAVLQKTPFSFDVSVWEFFWPLAVGARLVVAPPGAHRDPVALSELIRGEGITTLHFVPSMLRAWLDGADASACTSLRLVMSSGEALPADLVTRFFGALPSSQLHNLYGPTEAAVDVTHWPCAPDAGGSVPIGRPIANTRMYVLDGRGAPQPVGVPGELWIAGVQVGRGYWRRPALTAERFVPDPFAPLPGARMYRTGDRARWRADGTLEYLGRTDFQVKVRGFRIEPGEIEAALAALPGVRQAVVDARPGPAGARLVAWIAGEDGPPPAPDTLRSALARTLPDHMVPSVFVPVDSLPLTPSGKVDRRALPEPDVPADASVHATPRTPTEETVAAIWGELLGLEGVGANDRFFDLGGHSLLGTRVVARLREALDVEVPLAALFDAPRLADFAARVDDAVRAGAGVHVPPITRTEGDTAPLSFAQERLWFIDRLEPGAATYNMSPALRMHGALDAAALEAALAEVVRRHEPLRTVLPEVDGAPVQRILPPGVFRLEHGELEPLPKDARDGALARTATEWARMPFDLGTGPLFRARLIRIAPDDHALLPGMHHAVSDGWSTGILFGELFALYDAFAAGRPSPLPPLPVRYADFAAWQRAWLAGEALERQLAWWRDRLEGAPALLELPLDHPRPAVQSARGAAHTFAVPAEVADSVRSLARREGATLFMALLAAWNVLLSRWSGQGDVVVGTPVAGRTRRETEGLIGLFVNTLALRTELGDDPAFRALLARVRRETLGAFAHQDLPFEKLVEELRPERSLGHAPVFQAMFILQNTPDGPAAAPAGLELAPVAREGSQAKVDLTLTMAEGPDGSLHASLGYAADLFDADSVERMAAQLVALLRGIGTDPDAPVSSLPLADETDGERSADDADGLPDATVHALFAAQAARTPDAPALAWSGGTWSYAELDARAERIAVRVRDAGAGPERIVAVLAEYGPDAAAALLGVLASGAAYLPLDPAHPAGRLSYVLADSGAAAVLAQPHLRDRLPADIGVPVLSLDGSADAADPIGSPTSALTHSRTHALPGSAAYVIYTSGSTGLPKAVVVPHAAAAAHLRHVARWWELAPEDRVEAFAALTFDPSVEQVLAPLLAGASVALRDPAVGGAAEYVRRIRATGVTVASPPTGYWAQLVADDTALAELRASVRMAVVGGEAMAPELARRWYAAPGAAVLVNAYGPTEAVVQAAAFRVTPEVVEARPARVPIGAGVGGRTLHVLDGRMRPVPAGVPGELYVGGPVLARGYLGRPALTAERFVPDPFGAPGSRLYRTGDRVRRRGDGALVFLGRADQQVKVRGFRIEPGEVEAVLRSHPAIRDTAVVARPDAGGTLSLVAYVVAEEGNAPDVDALRAHCGERLPAYMVPAAFVPMGALPLTSSGKVDRRALPAPEWAADAGAWVAPRTPTEETVAAVWAELLGRERVGANDRFFDLGGHSLLGTRVVSRLRERMSVEVPLAALFEAPRLADFAARVDEALRGGAGVRRPPIRRTEGDTAPLSFAQERLWFIDRLEPGSPLYNMSPSLRLRGPLDPAILADALREVVRRHEPLRTTLPVVDGNPVQRIGAGDGFQLRMDDLSHLSPEEREGEAGRAAAEFARAPFDLEQGPLFRAGLIRIAPDDHALLLAMHHAVGDGWSIGILFRELFALYDAFAAGRPSPLAPLPIRYADYAAWQRAWLSGAELERQVAYWRDALAGAPALLELPADRPRPPLMSRRGALHAFAVPADVAGSVRALARREGSTLFMALLAALDVVLARGSGQDDVVVGTPVAGRTQGETEGLIGLFVNTLALRTDLSGDPSFLALLERVRAATLGAYAHQDLPFEKLAEELKPERSLAYTPLFQVLFNLQGTGDGPAEAPATLALAPLGGKGAPDAKVDLTLTVTEQDDGSLYATLGYAADLFDAATVERMAAQWARVLAAAAAGPEAPLSSIDLLSDGERSALADWNRTARDFPARTALERFDGWVARTPDAPALAYEGASLSFAALDTRSRRIARALVARGIGVEARVGLCVERSAEMIVALLGVLRAGAAYVPLDPAFPPARMADMLADAGASLVLAQDGLLAALEGVGAEILAISEAEAGAPDAADLPLVRPASLAYVIYTSGSTGRPKGVAVEHRQLAHYVQAVADRLALPERASYATVSTIAADLGHTSVFGALCGGGCLHVIGAERIASAEAFAAYLAAHPVDVLKITPSHLAALMGGGDPAAVLPRRCLVLGGEASQASWVDGIRALRPDLRVVNHYGPTETTVGGLAYVADSGLPDTSGGTVPIGHPLPNARAYVLDATLRPVSIGVPGELCIGGWGVARGYLGRAALTAERFVPDPFADVPGARMYRTGDRARRLVDGAVEFLGRMDQQVKVRGFRVEPGEVESVLRTHPAIRDAAVVAHPDPMGTTALVAYAVGAEGAVVDADALHRHCAARLPAYMVPAAFVPLDALPLTPNGKLDRAALPAPGHAGGGYVVPRDVTELEVARIWSEALGMPRVGANDDFFRLGGHSLLALRMMSRIRERFGRDLPLATLFRHPTVAAFADALRGEGADADDGRLLVTLTAGDGRPPLIFFPPAGGTVTHYADLARLLGPDQPFLALQAPGVTGAEAPVDTMAAMVDRYLDEIRRAHPHGPYWLGGWSAGGLTAFEAARRLRECGEEVALLAIVDAPAPDSAREDAAPDRVELYRRFARSTVTEDEALLDGLAEELRAQAPEERLAGLSRWIARHGGPMMDAELERVGRVMAVYEATARAVRDYRDPPPLDVPVALFVASEGKPEDGAGPEARPARWRPFVRGEMAVRVIPGAHAELVLEPAAVPLAEALREVMEQVRKG